MDVNTQQPPPAISRPPPRARASTAPARWTGTKSSSRGCSGRCLYSPRCRPGRPCFSPRPRPLVCLEVRGGGVFPVLPGGVKTHLRGRPVGGGGGLVCLEVRGGGVFPVLPGGAKGHLGAGAGRRPRAFLGPFFLPPREGRPAAATATAAIPAPVEVHFIHLRKTLCHDHHAELPPKLRHFLGAGRRRCGHVAGQRVEVCHAEITKVARADAVQLGGSQQRSHAEHLWHLAGWCAWM